jgi:putative ABC transport system substrate-binding protein
VRRRDFIKAIAGSAAGWLAAANAQRAAAPTVGIVGFGSLEAVRASFAPAQRRLAEMGYVEGRNLTLEYRGADSHEERLPALVNDLVQRGVASIVAFSGPSISAAEAATTSIPIIFFTGFDPVSSGFVASLSRPGGNATGIAVLNTEVLAKRLQLLRELVPTAKSIAWLYNRTSFALQDHLLKDMNSAADALGVKLLPVEASRPGDFEGAFASIARADADALLVGPDAAILANREVIIGLAAQHKVPAVYSIREFAAAGGLMSYGPNYPDAYRQVGDYLGRVLKGDKPENLPVLQVTKIELVINMKTAKALGLTIPLALLSRADEVIE